jgi:protein TonB
MMLEREVFASFQILQRGRYGSPPFKTGVSVSLVAHVFFLVAMYFVSIGSSVTQETYAESGNEGEGIPPGEIVEIRGPLIMPPPEVIRQLLGETASRQPVRPDFLAEQSSVARGESNPNPRGRSQLPRSSGEARQLSESVSADSREKAPPTESAQQTRERRVVESTERPPTVASDRTPAKAGEQGDKPGTDLPDPGEGPQIAKLGSTTRELPVTIENQESAVTARGPISVNARGVGALEAYRAYLERAIQQRWQIPPEANLLERPVSVTIEFEIAKDGRLLITRAYDTTGMAILDQAAMRAIRLAAPFRPLPDVFPFPSQIFTDTFVYYPPKSN